MLKVERAMGVCVWGWGCVSHSISTLGAQGEMWIPAGPCYHGEEGPSASSSRAEPSAPGCGSGAAGAAGAVGSRCQSPQGGDSVLTAPPPTLPIPLLEWQPGLPLHWWDRSTKASSGGLGLAGGGLLGQRDPRKEVLF